MAFMANGKNDLLFSSKTRGNNDTWQHWHGNNYMEPMSFSSAAWHMAAMVFSSADCVEAN
eukprot:1146208-Pelagomonas_calceolata.AAC.14